MALDEKEKLFCKLVVQLGDTTQAFRRSGMEVSVRYSAREIEADLMKRPDILAEINKIRDSNSAVPIRDLEMSLKLFTKAAWPTLEGGRKLNEGWVLEAIAEHLEAVMRGDIKQLLINLPPRMMKSSLVSVMFPVWSWLHHPDLQFLCVSYVDKLAMRDNVRSRRIIRSKWFQERFSGKFQLSDDQDTKIRIENNQGGYRVISSVDGATTGDGGDILLIDDPNNVRDSSDVAIQKSLEWWQEVMPTRLNDFNTGRKIVVQQRTHAKDISGHILANERDEWIHLNLPMEYEAARKCYTIPLPSTGARKWCDPREKEGELLWPARIDEAALKKLKAAMSQYAVAGQFQQRPAPEEGGIIKKTWFRKWERGDPPKCDFVIQSWDTAMSIRKDAAFSCCTTWGVFKGEHDIPCVILLGMWRKRVEFPELYEAMKWMSEDYRIKEIKKLEGGKIDFGGIRIDGKHRPDVVLVEDKVSGKSVAQMLSRMGTVITRFNPDKHGDKIERVRKITHIIEAGRVFMPYMAPLFTKMRPFADEFVDQCSMFPSGESRDLVDTFTMALIRLRDTGWVGHPLDETSLLPSQPTDTGARPALY